METFLFSGMMLWPDGRLEAGDLLVEGGQIAAVTAPQQIARQPEQQQIISVPAGSLLAPGLIDTQINGAFGHDFSRTPRQISAAARHLPAFGVTSFVPTLVSSPMERYWSAIQAVQSVTPEPEAAAILGLHLEGPYLSSNMAGAHAMQYLRRPRLDELHYFDPNFIRIMTVAPELPEIIPVIQALTAQNVCVGLSHSVASYDQTKAAMEAGARFGAHVFNAMGSLHHRYPGIVGALLAEPGLAVSLIADGVHIHPALLNVVVQAKGPQRVCLISDGAAAAGLGEGEYYLGEQKVTAAGHTVRLANGTLAGTTLTLDQAVRNMVNLAGQPPAVALQMASCSPADLLGLSHKGRLAPGCDADLILLDEHLTVTLTMIKGKIVYKS
jgi:N-acetylglucosamine-6-phosphate deacetylase